MAIPHSASRQSPGTSLAMMSPPGKISMDGSFGSMGGMSWEEQGSIKRMRQTSFQDEDRSYTDGLPYRDQDDYAVLISDSQMDGEDLAAMTMEVEEHRGPGPPGAVKRPQLFP